VVTTPIPGARELLTDPAWGQLVARDKLAIASAVSQILAAPPSRKAVQRGAEGFSWEANAEALVAHWRRLAAD
jgi:teichuronic acid biosynthesis glycosyltransferase TuaC